MKSESKDLASFSYLRQKGVAKIYHKPQNLKELLSTLFELDTLKKDYYILGRGSNTLFISEKIKRPIIHFLQDEIHVGESQLIILGSTLARAAGEKLFNSDYKNLLGVETIPGTIGAGIKNNCTFQGYDYYSTLQAILTYHDGKTDFIKANQIKRGYRSTDVQGVVLYAFFSPEKTDERSLLRRKELALYRVKNQVISNKTLGSTFKNPEGERAYRLINQVDISKEEDRIRFSAIHKNFLEVEPLTNGRLIYNFLKKTTKKVLKRTNIRLEFEINLVR